MTDLATVEALVAYAGQISEAAQRSGVASEIQHRFVNGGVNEVVETESGPLPTLAKWREDLSLLDTALANATDPSKGVALIGCFGRDLAAELGEMVANPRRFGAEGNGLGRKLSAKFATLAEAKIFYPFATTLNCTLDWAGTQAAFNYAHANKIGNVGIPFGHFKYDLMVQQIGYVGLIGGSRGFGMNSGTILERPEGTGSLDPVINFGTGNSLPNFYAGDFTVIGDTTVRHPGFVFNVIGMHKPVMERISFHYVRGTPIIVNSPSNVARPEFMTFRDIGSGMDFSGFGGRDPAKARSDDPNSTGIWIRDTSGNGTGTADDITLDGCVFLGKSNGDNSGLLVDTGGDNVKLYGGSLAGSKYGVTTSGRQFLSDMVYLEGLHTAFRLKNNYGNVNKGCKVFHINLGLIASCRYTLAIEDDAVTLNSATKGKINGPQIYTNYATWPEGHDVVHSVGPLSMVTVEGISTNFGNEGPTGTGCRVVRTGMLYPERVQGQLSILRDTLKLNVEGLKFPPVMVPSADPNMLDDYREIASFLPVLTCDVPGDLAVTYASRSGKLTKVGNFAVVEIKLVTSSLSYSSASGNLKLTGMPFSLFGALGPIAQSQGITYVGNELSLQGITGNPELFIRKSGSGTTIGYVQMSAVPSGTNVTINATFVVFL